MQLKAIRGKRVAYRGCNIEKKGGGGVQWIILLDTDTERVFLSFAGVVVMPSHCWTISLFTEI